MVERDVPSGSVSCNPSALPGAVTTSSASFENVNLPSRASRVMDSGAAVCRLHAATR
jgi:hypothetical protein